MPEDPEKATYRVDSGVNEASGPFVYVGDALTGAITLRDTDCSALFNETLLPRDYLLVVGDDVQIRAYGAGERPTGGVELPGAADC